MNTNKLKKFATKARISLMSNIRGQLRYLEIGNINTLPSYRNKEGVQVNDISFSEWKKLNQRKNLIQRVNEIWEEQLVEEIAYLWFNRFIALRYMEVNNYLSYGAKVLSSEDASKFEPDIIANALHLVWLNLDKNRIYEFLDETTKDGLYKYLIIEICNSLHSDLPFMFEHISDYTELLFPDNLLARWDFLDSLISEVDEEDWKEVEILGWLYQYYISDKKDLVFEEMKSKNKKISKENIPAATQLFTPKWIVKYMVENSVGKTWLESHPNKELQSKWEYYIESVYDENSTEKPKHNPNLKPEDITVLDPAMWSWHILVYAFEVLYEIYKSAGYAESDIPTLILRNNLYGLEIDDRAWQLGCFAVIMKARKYDKKILKQNIKLNICSIQETHECSGIDERKFPNLSKLCSVFRQWKLLWSLITLGDIDIDAVDTEFTVYGKENTFDKSVLTLPLIIEQAKLIHKQYSCVVSNPPYMWSGWMDKDLTEYLKKNYPDTKSDLMTCFVERNLNFSNNWGYIGMIILPSWLFLSSFEKLRANILENYTINSLLHMGRWIFWVDWGSTAFTLKKEFNPDSVWAYFRLHKRNFQHIYFEDIGKIFTHAKSNHDYRYDFDDYRWEDGITEVKKESNENWLQIYYIQKQDKFSSIPWSPIAYWVSGNVREIFHENKKLWDLSEIKQWMSTADNERFLRNWFEVNFIKKDKKWFSYNKWGDFRKWYGNLEYFVNWENNWLDLKNFEGSVIRNEQFFFKSWVTWSAISSNNFWARIQDDNHILWWGSNTLFMSRDLLYILGILSTKLANNLLNIINPTLNFSWGVLEVFPIVFPKSQEIKDQIDILTQKSINISKEEWDSRETSWHFTQNELIKHKTNSSIENAYTTYCKYWEDKFYQQHKNEEELNRIFIEIYGLKDEMTPEVELKDITLLSDETKIVAGKLEFQKDEIVKQFISYAVGCMMWRYSLDTPGLVFAGGEYDSSRYISFKSDDDGIIPILSDEYFDDDIVARFKEFVRVSFGADMLSQNLDFIAVALGKKWNETSLDRIRKYFLTEFYKDHVQRYKKRPIYWLFTTGKDATFSTLVYLHRYEKWAIGKIRMDYLHKLQWKLEWIRSNIDGRLVGADGKDRVDLEKEKNNILKQLDVLKQYDEKLRHMADQKIEIDLDDGVKVNYPKFWDLLGEIKL
jgi:type II restriction/modification system DNA methylase subunit YeeA